MSVSVLGEALGMLSLTTLLLIPLGLFIGNTVGAMPGLTAGMAVALVLPFTLLLGPVDAMGLLVGIYKGAMYGGAISAILFRIPGTPAAAPTAEDGYALTQKGYPRKALFAARYAGATTDTLSDLVLIFSFAPLAVIALAFGPREMVSLLACALLLLAAFAGRRALLAMFGMCFGILAGTVGTDPMTGVTRFGELPALAGGIRLIPFLVGLYAVTELIIQLLRQWETRKADANRDSPTGAKGTTAASKISVLKTRRDDDTLTLREYLSFWREMAIGFATGTALGALPGPGAVLATYSSYGLSGRLKKNRGTFGNGAIRGVVAAESANSATAGATLIPLFGIGIPGSAIAAIFAAALSIQGITPGPRMLENQPAVVLGIFVVMIIANPIHLLVGSLVARLWAYVGSIQPSFLIPVLAVVSALGVYAEQSRIADVAVALGVGVIGVVFRAIGVPLPVVLLSYVVGPMLEANIRRGIVLSRGELVYWVSSPISIGVYSFLTVGLAIFLIWTWRNSMRDRRLSVDGLLDD